MDTIVLSVKHLMSAEAACCMPDTSLREVAALMVDCDCGEIPVIESWESRKPVGVVTDRDIVCRFVAKGRDPLESTARDCMTSPVITVTPDMDLKTCVAIMAQHQIRRVPVVDEHGGLCGMLSQADIATRAQAEISAEMTERVSQPSVASSHVSS